MEIYILRHGESTANARHLVCGCSDYPLSERGKDQAKAICRFLANVKFTKIYTSSLSRAIGTIDSLDTEVAITIDARLSELNTGSVSDITLSELWARDERFKNPWLSPALRYPGGECFAEMISRISGWFDSEIKNWSPKDKVLIVGHEGTLRVIFLRLFGFDLADYPDFPIANCDYLYFLLSDGAVVSHKHVTLSSLIGDLHEARAADNIP